MTEPLKIKQQLFEQRSHYTLIRRAILFLQAHQKQPKNLTSMAESLESSEEHLQHTFSAWAGFSVQDFFQFTSKQHAQALLLTQPENNSATAEPPNTSPLHNPPIQWKELSPSECKKWGSAFNISFGVSPSPFGLCFIATSEKGICSLAFFDDALNENTFEVELKSLWPNANVIKDNKAIEALALIIFDKQADDKLLPCTLTLCVQGTAFQQQVWKALMTIPEGKVVSYQTIANALNKPTAARAVASAIANNNIGYLIPCHRVISSNATLNGYRWGAERKAAMIAYEQQP